MKSAEEFVRDGDLLSTIALIAELKARDLEMWKQGMTDAAGMLDDRDDYGLSGLIIMARDNAKGVSEIGAI